MFAHAVFFDLVQFGKRDLVLVPAVAFGNVIEHDGQNFVQRIDELSFRRLAVGVFLQILVQSGEVRQTPEAKFVYALDKILPIMLNYIAEGYSWHKYKITLAELH